MVETRYYRVSIPSPNPHFPEDAMISRLYRRKAQMILSLKVVGITGFEPVTYRV